MPLHGLAQDHGPAVMVFGEPPRSTTELLRSLSPALAAERCYTVEGSKAHVRQRVAPTGRRVSFKVGEALGGGTGTRCAVVEKVGPDPNGHDLVALVDRKR